MYDITKNYEISRKLATGGMILLKNEENLLPLRSDSRVGIVGKECLSLLKGGGGSSHVKCEYVRSLEYGILEKAHENKFSFYEPSLQFASEGEYTLEALNRQAKDFDTAIVTYKRDGCEGRDRVIGKNTVMAIESGAYAGETDATVGAGPGDIVRGFYYPSTKELDFFSMLEESDIKNVILILNISAIVDISFI